MSFVTRIPLLLLLAAAPAQAQTVSLANAIDQPTATVTGPGWTGRPAGAHDGVDCAGGVLLAGTASRTMTALVTRAHAGETSFWWYRTTGTATVTFSINGVTKAIYTGTGWQKQTVATLPGDQTLEWTISRPDTSDPGGTILVDELELSSAPAVAPGITALPATVTRRRLLENYLNLNQPVGWQPWTHVITADPPPDSWSVTGLPVGLTTQAGGIFAVFGQHTGTAPARGVYPVNLHATNAAGTGTSVWQLTVTDPPFVPAQTVTASRAALLQTSPSNPWRRRVAVEGLWTSITITGLPTGIIQDPAVPDTLLAQHMGTAPAVGTHAITVTATGPDGSTSPVILLSVAEQPPVLNADAPWMITATQLLGRPPLRPASAWPIIVTVTDGADVSAWNATGLPAGLRWTGSARQLVIDRTPGAPLPMLHEMPAGSPWPLRISATNADGTTLVEGTLYLQDEPEFVDFPSNITGRRGLNVRHEYTARWIGSGQPYAVSFIQASGLSMPMFQSGVVDASLLSDGVIEAWSGSPLSLPRGFTYVSAPLATPEQVLALNQTDLVLTTRGAGTAASSQAHDGVSALRLAPGGLLFTDVTGPGTLSFWWKGAGNFQAGSMAPEAAQTEWTKVTLPTGTGTTRLSWRSPDAELLIDEVHVDYSAPSDADGDGFSAALESWFGTSDSDSTAAPVASITTTEAGDVRFQFPSVPGNRYVVQSSANLTTWNSLTIQATGTTTAVIEPPAARRKFWRAAAP